VTGQTCACGQPGLIWIEDRRVWECGRCIAARHAARLLDGRWESGSCSDGPKHVIVSPELAERLRAYGIWGSPG
jgi:hypothetical protein